MVEMRLLITGGAGFIGSNFVHYVLDQHPQYQIVVLDKLTYAGRMENLYDVLSRITFVKGDICSEEDVGRVGHCEVIVNFAAETHVDRSITGPRAFVETDVLGTLNLLEYARKNHIHKYVQISTDEVYGSVDCSCTESASLKPSSPYSASKTGADLLVEAYHKTYGLPTVITRSSNNFGPYQYPEKLIPLLITNALRDKPLPVYGDGQNIRDWIQVRDNCSAIDLVIHKGQPGQCYNIAAGNERKNVDIVHLILSELGKSHGLIQFVADRPGHDRRYSLDWTKLRDLGWKPANDFEPALSKTVEWYVKNEWWWEPLVAV